MSILLKVCDAAIYKLYLIPFNVKTVSYTHLDVYKRQCLTRCPRHVSITRKFNYEVLKITNEGHNDSFKHCIVMLYPLSNKAGTEFQISDS